MQNLPQYDCINIPPGTQMSLYQSGVRYNDFVRDTGAMSHYSEAEKQATRKRIFYFIDQNPDWLSQFSGLDSFYNVHLMDHIGQSVTIKNGLIALDDQRKNQKDSLASELSVLDTLELDLEDVLEQIAVETDPGNLADLIGIRDSIQAHIDSMSYFVDSVQSSFDTQNELLMDTLEQRNDTLDANASYEIHEKFMNRIIFKLLQGDSLTVYEKDTIRELAMLCFGEAGIAIKEASSVAMGILEEYYSQYGCINEVYLQKPSANGVNDAKMILLPNPVNGELKIQGMFTEDLDKGDYEIMVFDQFGKLLSIDHHKKLNRYKLDTRTYVNGVYYLLVKGTEIMAVEKFVVYR